MANKAIKYRLYPTADQERSFAQTFGNCRYVWNQALGWRIAAYDADGTRLNYNDTAFAITKMKKYMPWLSDSDSAALQQTLRHLQTAFESFFKGESGFPKFKTKHTSKKSYTTPCQYPKSGKPTVRVGENYVHLPVIGDVPAIIHRKAKDGWKAKSATVSQDAAGDYYCSILYEYDEGAIPVSTGAKAIGLDYKSEGLYMDSDGLCAGMPKRFRDSQKKLAKAQHDLSRKQGSRKGEKKSKNWIKQQKRVNKIHRKIAHQRCDQLQKRSTEIANRYDLVCIEDLNSKAMANKGFGNGKATNDNGWGMFTRMLEYKLADRGKHLIRVNRWYPSSQICHMCGHKQKMPVSVRRYKCPACGMVFDRDHNAAINILNEGIRIFQAA